MIHFAGNPNCTIRTKDRIGPVSRVSDLGEFREWRRTFPDAYCSECADEPLPRTDSDRYAELRKLVEAVQIDSKIGTARAALDALLDWRHQ